VQNIHNMNTTNTRKFIKEYFHKLGLSDEAGEIYLALITYGSLPILELSRKTEIERTKLYRMIDELTAQGIVEEVVEFKKKLVKAADLSKIELLVSKAEENINYLKESLPIISGLITNLKSESPITQILYYRGKEGIRQMVWNSLKANNEVLSFAYRSLFEVVGQKFFDKWADEFELRKLLNRWIYTDEFVISEDYKKYKPRPFKGMSHRYIDQEVFSIPHQLEIYNDVTAIYNWYNGEVFGVEIYNSDVAKMQKQLFELVWNQAKDIGTIRDYKAGMPIIKNN
jgi:sugar-specific transcriptional regulator TrmB